MLIQETIQNWIADDSRDYEMGVYLFGKVSKNQSLKKHFSRPSTELRMEKLVYELNKLCKSSFATTRVHISPIVSVVEMSEDPEPKESTPETDLDLVPGECTNVKEITRLKNQAFQMRNALRSKLSLMSTKEERYEAVLKIMQYQVILKDCWHSLDYHKEHGRLPSGKLLGESKKKALQKRNANLRTYISKYKKKLETAKDPSKIEEWKNQLADFESEREQNKIKMNL